MKMEKILDYAVTRVSKPTQYAARFRIQGGGWSRLVRLKAADGSKIEPTIAEGKHTDEPENVQADIRRAVLALLQAMIQSDTMIATRSKYGTCTAAMTAYLKWYSENRKDKSAKFHGAAFIKRFGGMNPTRLDRQMVDQWILSMIDEGLYYDTIRLRVTLAGSMINWMAETGEWQRANPFTGRLKQYRNRFPAATPSKGSVEDEEYERLLSAASGDEFRAVRIFIQTARMTGLRPSEVVRLNTKHLDHNTLTWQILVSKTTAREYYRKIAIPAQLAAFIVNEGITGILPVSGLRNKFEQLRRETGIEVGMKTFRKDFSRRMEQAGANHDTINLHQGRRQSGVLVECYLTDTERAVTVCRPFIDTMFSQPTIRLVK